MLCYLCNKLNKWYGFFTKSRTIVRVVIVMLQLKNVLTLIQIKSVD